MQDVDAVERGQRLMSQLELLQVFAREYTLERMTTQAAWLCHTL